MKSSSNWRDSSTRRWSFFFSISTLWIPRNIARSSSTSLITIPRSLFWGLNCTDACYFHRNCIIKIHSTWQIFIIVEAKILPTGIQNHIQMETTKRSRQNCNEQAKRYNQTKPRWSKIQKTTMHKQKNEESCNTKSKPNTNKKQVMNKIKRHIQAENLYMHKQKNFSYFLQETGSVQGTKN